MNRVLDTTKKLVWGLAALSITSCLIRNDYNVIFAFLLLIILNNFYNQNIKLFTKIIVQILAVLTIADVIWLFVMMPTWSHLPSDKNEYWKGLSGIHTFGLIFAFLQLILKGLIMAYLVYDYKQKNPNELSDLWTFVYRSEKTVSKVEENKNVSAGMEMGGESDFKNPYM